MPNSVYLTNCCLSSNRMVSTPSAVCVRKVMRERDVKSTQTTVLPLLVKMVAFVVTLSMATAATALLDGAERDAV